VADRGEACSYEGYIWVGAFWCGGAYFLVRAARAAVCCAGLLGFGAGAVFCLGSDQVSICLSTTYAVLELVGWVEAYLAQARRAWARS
jgi:hypothetical protein